MNLHKKLQELSSDMPSTWLQEAEERNKNKVWQKRSALIALRVLRELRHKRLTQRDLAERMGVSAQQVNKIVKGQENLTLDTLVKLETALDIQLLHDGNTIQPVAVLSFGSLPIARKMFTSMRHVDQCSITMPYITSIVDNFDIDIVPMFIDTNNKHLHTRYPIEGKDKWHHGHAQLS